MLLPNFNSSKGFGGIVHSCIKCNDFFSSEFSLLYKNVWEKLGEKKIPEKTHQFCEIKRLKFFLKKTDQLW
jgi:hypothetical protein